MGGKKGRKGRGQQKAKSDQVQGAAGQNPDVTKLIFQPSSSQNTQVPLSVLPDILINGQIVSKIKGKATAAADNAPDALPSIAKDVKLDSEQQTTGDKMIVFLYDTIDSIKISLMRWAMWIVSKRGTVQEEKHSNQGPMEQEDVIQDQAVIHLIDPKSDPDIPKIDLIGKITDNKAESEEVKDQEIKADQVSMATGDVPVYQGLAILTYPNSEPDYNANVYEYEGRMMTVPTGLAVFAPGTDEVKVDSISLECADLVQNLIDTTSEPDDNSRDQNPEISAPLGKATENVVNGVTETSFKSEDTVQNPIDPMLPNVKPNVIDDPEPMLPNISDLLDEITDIVEETETRDVKHETIADRASLETGDISQDRFPLETGDVAGDKPNEDSSDSIPPIGTKLTSNEADDMNLEDKYLKPTEVMLAKSRPLKHQMPPSAAESFTFESALPNTGRAVGMTDAEVLSLLQFLHEAFNKMSARSPVYSELETVLHLGSAYESLDPIGRRYATRLLLKFYLGIADGWDFSDRVVEYHDWQQSVSTAKIFQNKPAGREENQRSSNKYRNPEGAYGRLPQRRDFRGREQYPLENQRNYPSNPNREPPSDYRHCYMPPHQRDNRPRDDYQRENQHRDDYQRGNQHGDDYQRGNQPPDDYQRGNQHRDNYQRGNQHRDDYQNGNQQRYRERGDGSRENVEEQYPPSAFPDAATAVAAVLALGAGLGGATSQSGEPQGVGKGGAIGGAGDQSKRYVAQSSSSALEGAEAHSSGGALNGADGAHSGGGTLEGDMEAHSSGGALNSVSGRGRDGGDGAHASGGAHKGGVTVFSDVVDDGGPHKDIRIERLSRQDKRKLWFFNHKGEEPIRSWYAIRPIMKADERHL